MRKIISQHAIEMIEQLRLTDPIWNLEIPGETRWISREIWAFRGQSNAQWSIVPSAFRSTTVLGYKPGATTPSPNPLERKDQERKTLSDFLFFADRMGLRVPGDGQHFRVPQLPGHMPRLPMNFWPWEYTLETLAIAQHHGVPTRLLDFSYNPMVAAFFAAYDAWEKMDRPSFNAELNREEEISVWAINLLVVYASVSTASMSGSPPRIIVVTAPRAENSYLHYQDGFFLLDLQADQHGYPPLEDTIEDVQREMLSIGRNEFSADQVYQLRLSWNQVPQLLAFLWNEQYNIARLQPTHDKAVQALKDHADLFR
jgi:hypothetical protein